MSRRLSFLLVLSLWLGGASVRAAEPDPKVIDGLVQRALKAWEVPGAAVVVVHNDRVVYLKGFGVRSLDGEARPVTPDTVFPLSSCTKAFTSLALAMLVDDGLLDWDDPVRKHLPAFRLADPLADANVTLRDLLCHRTGLAAHDFLWYRAPWGAEEQVRRIGLVKPSRSFRSAFQYQNILFVAAGQAGAAAADERWEEMVRRRVVEPLGMTSVSFTTTAALKGEDHTGGHRWGADGRIVAVPWCPMEQPNPALSINASARDLGQWLRFQLGDGSWGSSRLVSARQLAETHTPQMALRLEGIDRKEQPCTSLMSYGLGWVIQDYRGHKLISHGGNIDGVRAHITFAPDDQLGVAVLSNLEGTRMNLALAQNILDAYLELEPRDWNGHFQACMRARAAAAAAEHRQRLQKQRPGTKPTLDLAAYAGTYEEPAYGKAEVVVEDGGLVWKWSSFRAPLKHFHFDTYTVDSDPLHQPQLQFTLGADGTVVGLRVFDVEFRKAGRKK